MVNKLLPLILPLLLLLQCSKSRDAEKFGKIELIVGQAQVFDARSLSWKPVVKSHVIMLEDTIKTEAESRLEIAFGDDNEISIGEKTKIHISERTTKEGHKNIQIFNCFGTVVSHIKKLKDKKSYEVKTPTAIAAIRGTYFSVSFSLGRGVTDVSVLGGKVWVFNPFVRKTVIVVPGFFTSIYLKKAPFVPKKMNYGQWKKFNHLLKPGIRSTYKSKYKIKTPLLKSMFPKKGFKGLNKAFTKKKSPVHSGKKSPFKNIIKGSKKLTPSKKAAPKTSKDGAKGKQGKSKNTGKKK